MVEELQRRAKRTGDSFKAVVNDAIRRGLSAGTKPSKRPPAFKVEPRACGFRAGIDIGKLNQLVDDLELEHFGDRVIHDATDHDRS